jgi:hypothetical protein
MKPSILSIATAILGAALLSPQQPLQAQTASSAAPAKAKTTTARKRVHRAVKPAKPSLESQIQSLREDMQTQIQTLQQQLTASQAQLQAAQAAAAAAQATAQQAQQQASQQQQTLTDNTTAVSSLQGAVTDLKTTSSSVQTMVTENQAKVQKQIEHPDSIHFKGVTISPTGSFIEAATVDRTHATGSDIPTPFTSIPLENTNQAALTEFFATARQSRLALDFQGKLDRATIEGYYEMDWLGTGVTSNNNQSNSYVMRERVLWAQAKMNSGLTIGAGQMWSMATPYRHGLANKSEDVPLTIDPNYNAGFTWARQYSARAVQQFGNKMWLGVSLEAPQTLAVSGSGTPVNYLIGSAGTGGGLYNSAGAPGATSSANLANYSFNVAPDMLAKAVFEPGFGHFEVYGIARIFRDRIYPGNTTATTTTTTGGVTTTTTTVTYNSKGAYNDKTVGGGIGGSFLVPVTKHFDVGLEGLYGDGIGRYGASQIGDTTLRPDAQLALLHGFSALGKVEYHATPRLDIYGYYGGDEAFRRYFYTNAAQTKAEGYGNPLAVQTGCFTEPAPGSTPTAGFTPGSQSNCTANTRAVEEGTLGYWYDFYKGDKGRFRQSIQYSYIDRLTWSGIGSPQDRAPMGNENVIETSLRYYLP